VVPFFVVDRPISLKIIQGLKIPRGKKIGLMAHANTSPNFRKAFRAYPHRQVVKMCDSAIFNLGGYKNGYAELFALYEEMETDYGVMIDVFRDSRATIESARKALAAYDFNKHHFKLVAVAQGKTVEEYLDCYRQLRSMGFEYVAVGGLLQKVEKTARYTYVRDENLMTQVLQRIHQEFKPSWLFALGCLHPSRLKLFNELNVWGDYKGWIFEYKKRDDSMREAIKEMSGNHLQHTRTEFRNSRIGGKLKNVLAKRTRVLRECSKAHAELLTTKKALKIFIRTLAVRLRTHHRKLAGEMDALKSRGLLDISRTGSLMIALRRADVSSYSQNRLVELATSSRLAKTEFVKAEQKLDDCNTELRIILQQVKQDELADKKLKTVASRILSVLVISEQRHRIRQVRTYIEGKILDEIG